MSVVVKQIPSVRSSKFCVVCSKVYRDDIRLCPDDGTPLAVEEDEGSEGRVGKILGQYRLLRLLGEGGASAVYEAEHTRLERHVAIKILHRDLGDSEMVTRFFNEARAVNHIGHPNIIDIEDFVHAPSGEHYMVMEFLKGEDLRSVLDREKKLAPERVAELGAQAASALAAVHRAGIIHRDLKPDNIFIIEKDGLPTCKLLDFGIAKFTESKEGVTREGMTMGTPKYMSPEQIVSNGVPDQRSDIYALGMVMYEALAGRPAFVGDLAHVLRAHIAEEAVPPSKVRGEPISSVLESVVLKCLEKDPAARFQHADEIRTALRAERPIRRMHTPLPFAVPGIDPSASITLRMRKSASRRRWVPIVIALVLAAAAVAAFVVVPKLTGEGKPATAAASPAPAPTPAAPTPMPPPAPVAPTEKAVPMITVQLTSSPDGAEVFMGEDRKRLGVTPLSVQVPMSQTIAPFIAKFANGEEVTHRVTPNRALTLSFTQPVAAKPSTGKKRVTAPDAPAEKAEKKKPTGSSTGREDTVDPFTFK